MKHLKSITLFESFGEYQDDSDSMARFQLFESDTTMAFEFNRELITDADSIKDLIEKYNYYYKRENSWGGGPPPRGFVNYFNQNYSKSKASLVTYPTIDLIIETPNYGEVVIGFSIINKTYKLYRMNRNQSRERYHKNVVTEIRKYIMEEVRPLKMDEVIELLQLNVKNFVNWEWKK